MPLRWDDNETFPVADWKRDITNNDTRLGYGDWTNQKIRSRAADLSDKDPALLSGVRRAAESKDPPLPLDNAVWPRLLMKLAKKKYDEPVRRWSSHGILWPLFIIGLSVAIIAWAVYLF